MTLWICLTIVAFYAARAAVWAARKLFGPLIMEWCVPTGSFPAWLTLGDVGGLLLAERWLTKAETDQLLRAIHGPL